METERNNMTDQSNNDQFHTSSFMRGHNAEYLEQLYARYTQDLNAVRGGRSGAARTSRVGSAC